MAQAESIQTAPPAPKKGLEDIVAGSTELCFIDGREGRLLYRGIDIALLAEQASFEEVLYLLWYDALPTRTELEELKRKLAESRTLPPPILDLLRRVPPASHPMDVLRTCVSALALYDPDVRDLSPEANQRKALRLTGQFASIVATYDRLRKGKAPVAARSDLGHAADFLYLLNGEIPHPLAERALNAYLVMLADHGFNASTFTARVTASTLSDLHSAITSALGALKGPLHGGANEKVMEMLFEIQELGRVEGHVRKALAAGKRIMGFGHRVYKTEDPRARILRQLAREIGDWRGELRWFEMCQRVEEVVHREKGLWVNVDFYSAPVLYQIGLPIDLFTPLFAVSRIVGWTAHVQEQYSDNRLIRPEAEYVGPTDRPFIPLAQR